MKIFNIIVTFMLVGSITGCDFLDTPPENDLVKEDYWQSEADVEALMMSSYVSLANSTRLLFDWGEMRSNTLAIVGGEELNCVA